MAFQYVAVTADGQRRTGRIEAETRAEALARIKELGHQPVQLRLEAKEEAAPAPSAKQRRISAADIAAFTRQLADLTLAGLVLDRSLTVLAEQAESASLRTLIENVPQEVRGGTRA